MEELNSLSPLDGRYKKKTENLRRYFSEAALVRYRTSIEIVYLRRLVEFLQIPYSEFEMFRMTDQEILRVKEIEKEVNHDVKAVELFLRERITNKSILEFIHFGLTSQDVNSSSYVLSMKDANRDLIIPKLDKMTSKMEAKVFKWLEISMLSRTHGQTASPTTLGKEMMVFVERLKKQIFQLRDHKYTTKFGGAIGNFNGHVAAYPSKDWLKFGDEFIKSIGLERNRFTTQIDHYDNYSEIFDILKRISTILIDFCRDVWMYVSMEYFTQANRKGEVGSSAMPHKINPINFENAEGNLMIAVSMFEFMSRKLPISRLQRDLTDSTVLRNIGTCYGHFLIGLESILSGMERLDINREKIKSDLQSNKIVLAEAIQTILRKEGVENSYLLIKDMTRGGKDLDTDEVIVSIEERGIRLSEEAIKTISDLSVHNYIGRF